MSAHAAPKLKANLHTHLCHNPPLPYCALARLHRKAWGVHDIIPWCAHGRWAHKLRPPSPPMLHTRTLHKRNEPCFEKTAPAVSMRARKLAIPVAAAVHGTAKTASPEVRSGIGPKDPCERASTPASVWRRTEPAQLATRAMRSTALRGRSSTQSEASPAR